MSKKTFEVLSESMLYVLMAFMKSDMCGTEIVDFISKRTKGRIKMGPGTLYTILSKFEENSLIEETEVQGRKRIYAVTEKGRKVYYDEVERLRRCLCDIEEEEKGRSL